MKLVLVSSFPDVSPPNLKFLIFPELAGKHQGKRPLERPRRQWDDSKKMVPTKM
jgi:hypothetical protein